MKVHVVLASSNFLRWQTDSIKRRKLRVNSDVTVDAINNFLKKISTAVHTMDPRYARRILRESPIKKLKLKLK